MNVLVTGGAGFIGTALVRSLLDDGHDVSVVDSRGAFPDPAVRSVVGDIRDPAVLDRALRADVQVVAHLAARTSVLRSLDAPAETVDVNVAATAALLERARRLDVGQIVFASTNAVVGTGGEPGGLIRETSVLRPLTPYGASKAAAEMLISGYASGYQMHASTLRFTNVYGPGMLAAGKDSVVARLMRAAAGDRGIDVYGDGTSVRDYIYVGDVVRAIRAGLTGHAEGVIVIGSGKSVSVLDLVALAREVTGRELPLSHLPAQAGEMAAVRVDISHADELGLGPRVDLRQGLHETWLEASRPPGD